MVRDLETFKEFLKKTNYRCAKKNGEALLLRTTADPDVVFISPEEYLTLADGVAPASAPAPPSVNPPAPPKKEKKPEKEKKEKDEGALPPHEHPVQPTAIESMTFQELKKYAKDNDITFTKNVTKVKLLEKIRKACFQ